MRPLSHYLLFLIPKSQNCGFFKNRRDGRGCCTLLTSGPPPPETPNEVLRQSPASACTLPPLFLCGLPQGFRKIFPAQSSYHLVHARLPGFPLSTWARNQAVPLPPKAPSSVKAGGGPLSHIPKSFPGTQSKWQHSSVRFQKLRPHLIAYPPPPPESQRVPPSTKTPTDPRSLPRKPWSPHLPRQDPTTASLPEPKSLK